MQIKVQFLPPTSPPAADRAAYDLFTSWRAQATVIVIDVLRATTTMLHALAAGAARIIPCLEIDEARRIAQERPGECVLGGERKGMRIAGFDLGNSPAEYTAESVRGKTVVMSTTNGTRAMQMCRDARRILLGAFGNISTLVAAVRGLPHLEIVCAGTDNHETLEDILCAGLIVSELRRTGSAIDLDNQEARDAAALWHAHVGIGEPGEALLSAMRESRGGRNLVELGYDRDIELAARIDATPVLGELFMHRWEVTATAFDESRDRPR